MSSSPSVNGWTKKDRRTDRKTGQKATRVKCIKILLRKSKANIVNYQSKNIGQNLFLIQKVTLKNSLMQK